jgi:hypothetical protein
VKVTAVPVQIVVVCAAIVTAGVAELLTTIVIVFDVAVV